MKLTVFGSTGSVGKIIVQQALALGHQVVAHTRSPEKIAQPHRQLKVAKGDVLDMASVESAIKGADAVICALGMPLMNREGLRAKGTKNIVAAMEKADVKRFVCLSGLGAGDSRSMLPWHYRYVLVPLLMRHLFADHEGQERHVKDSLLDWVVVRPGSFVKGTLTQQYKHGFSGTDTSLKFKISHQDVADFMLKQLTDSTYLHKTPGLSY